MKIVLDLHLKRNEMAKTKTIILRKESGSVDLSVDLNAVFATLSNGEYVMTIARRQSKRTLAQNDLLWLWLTCIESETGTPKDDAYLYYCKKFLLKRVTMGERVEVVYQTSSKLNTAQMTEFLDKIQADAASELGIQLPKPDDRYWESFFNEYH